jgi:hypothetical protein
MLILIGIYIYQVGDFLEEKNKYSGRLFFSFKMSMNFYRKKLEMNRKDLNKAYTMIDSKNLV